MDSKADGIDSLESAPGLHKRLKIRALAGRYDKLCSCSVPCRLKIPAQNYRSISVCACMYQLMEAERGGVARMGMLLCTWKSRAV